MLTVQSFPTTGIDTDGTTKRILIPWASNKYPGTVPNPAIVTATAEIDFVFSGFPNDTTVLNNAYMKLSWTSTQNGGVLLTQSQVTVAQVCRINDKCTSHADLHARIWVNETDRFDTILLRLQDSSSGGSQTDVLGSLSDSTWADVSVTDIDITSFATPLRMLITAKGTDTPANVGATEFRLEYFWLRFYCPT